MTQLLRKTLFLIAKILKFLGKQGIPQEIHRWMQLPRTMNPARQMRIREEEERKAQAAELYSRVLNSQFDDITLWLIDEYIENGTPKNPYGRRISKRLPQEVERGLYEGARTNAVDALFSRISESAVPASRRNRQAERRRIARIKKEALKGWAIAIGNWHTDLSEFTNDTEPFASGSDSDAYYAKDGIHVIKASKGKSSERKFAPDLDNIPLFNYVFPNTAYEIVGYGEIGRNKDVGGEYTYPPVEDDIPSGTNLREDSSKDSSAENPYIRFRKAPNGKESNLDARRYEQVRTNGFKEWFGDWKAKEFPLSDRYVSELSGNEFAKDGKTDGHSGQVL